MVYGSWFTVDLGVLVHAPQTGLRWTESTTLSSGMVYEQRVHARVAGEGGCSPVSPTAVLLPAVSSLVSLRGGASAQLTRVEAPPSLGVFIGGVTTACGVPWCADHGGSLPGMMVVPVRWLRPW